MRQRKKMRDQHNIAIRAKSCTRQRPFVEPRGPSFSQEGGGEALSSQNSI